MGSGSKLKKVSVTTSPITRKFDLKFGENFLATLPRSPGVYRIYDASDRLIYVGKAKDLRRRLSQYRLAKKRKAHRKMVGIITESARIDYVEYASEGEALLAETLAIQHHRPKWNVVGAYFFLYPLIGLRETEKGFYLCYTTDPESFPGFEFFGAFRSRGLTRQCFYAIVDLLRYVLHPMPPKKTLPSLGMTAVGRYSKVIAFRQTNTEFREGLRSFLRGEEIAAMATLILALLENADARDQAKEVQEKLNHLKRFYRRESALLRRSCERAGYSEYPVPQRERDLIFVRARFRVAPPSRET